MIRRGMFEPQNVNKQLRTLVNFSQTTKPAIWNVSCVSSGLEQDFYTLALGCR